jgi:hypothetical protein
LSFVEFGLEVSYYEAFPDDLSFLYAWRGYLVGGTHGHIFMIVLNAWNGSFTIEGRFSVHFVRGWLFSTVGNVGEFILTKASY